MDRYARDTATADERYTHIVEILRAVQEDESGNRRRLSQLRATEEYELAFSEQEPLVSVLIPTYNRYEMLRDRAIPSVLAQTYERIELIVVGDQAPPETARVLSEFNNEQIRYVNLPQRGPYPEDDQRAWLVKGVPPINGALSLARGRWIAPFSDDDALRPNAIETMVARCQDERFEVAYGRLQARGGLDDAVIGGEPPRHGNLGLQGGVFHAGLRFFGWSLADDMFDVPSDWSLVRRMWRAGVRIGFVDELVCDYFPTPRSGSETLQTT
jgi:glycosyltransferase involved in cell wall biosynthesis